jgi:hypothetical protein
VEQLRDCELGAIVNRDLSRRVRTVNGITSHKQVVRNDIKLAAKIIQNLDKKASLWVDDDDDKTNNSDVPVSLHSQFLIICLVALFIHLDY